MVEIKTDKYIVRIHDGAKFKADGFRIPEEAVQRFGEAILRSNPDYFTDTKATGAP